MAATASKAVLRLPAVKTRVGLSRSCLYKKIALGEFPKPIRLGARAVAWVECEVEGWLADRIKASRNVQQPVRG